MVCKECLERREQLINAALEGRIAAAAGHALKGAGQMIGIVPKVPTETLDGVVDTDGEAREIEADTSFVKPKKPRAKRS
jgi:hypothetical protein